MTILLAKPLNKLLIGSRFIQWCEGVEFSHCAILIDGYVYESVYPKFRKIDFGEWLNHYEVIEMYSLDNANNQAIKEMGESWIGNEYSLLQLVVIGLGLIFDSFNLYVSKIHWNGTKKSICSEFVARVLAGFYGVTFSESMDTIGLREIKTILEEKRIREGWLAEF